jgi:hypothetical protein
VDKVHYISSGLHDFLFRLTNNRKHEEAMERPWLYQTPMDILIKASNGASDFEINLDNH